MMEQQLHNEYHPDTVSPPGESLVETLAALGMAQADLARLMGCPQEMIGAIMNGDAPITAETARLLERVLGVTARFWLRREQHYQSWRARQQDDTQLSTE